MPPPATEPWPADLDAAGRGPPTPPIRIAPDIATPSAAISPARAISAAAPAQPPRRPGEASRRMTVDHRARPRTPSGRDAGRADDLKAVGRCNLGQSLDVGWLGRGRGDLETLRRLA